MPPSSIPTVILPGTSGIQSQGGDVRNDNNSRQACQPGYLCLIQCIMSAVEKR